MLLDLSVRNIVLIESLDITCSNGLTALTGETGAGKSILLDSVALVLGGRSDAGLLRSGCERATINARFSVPANHRVRQLLDEVDILCSDPLEIRRILGRDGRSRAFIEDQPVNIGLLNQVGSLLVDIQGQFDQQGLMDQKTHMRLLDGFAQLQKKSRNLSQNWQKLKKTQEKLEQAKEAVLNAQRDAEWLRHSLEELEQINPQPGEVQQLSARRHLLMNAEKLKEALNKSLEILSGNEGAESRLNDALATIEKYSELSSEKIEKIIAQIERSLDEVNEATASLNRLGSDTEAGTGELEEIEERLFSLQEIARKHRVTPDELMALKEKFALQNNMAEEGSSKLEKLQIEADQLQTEWLKQAKELSEQRRQAAKIFDQRVNVELPPLKLEQAIFQTLISERSPAQWNSQGIDDVGFLIQINPGTPPTALRKTASGGELSRILLALNVVLADTGDAATLIFDEVDSGVGGATASAVGTRLKTLSYHKQILVITHSPQVAALAENHFKVIKNNNEAGMAITLIKKLSQSERVEEIARMLSGNQITFEARAAAERLMVESHNI